MVSGIQGGDTGVMPYRSHQKMFKKLDKNGDGSLDQSELAGIASKTGQDASKMFASLDTNKDGKVDATEMETGAAKHRQEMGAQNPGTRDPQISEVTTALMNILKQLQSSSSGSQATGTDASTQAAGGVNPQPPSPEEMFKRLDANGDGTLDQSELTGIASKTGQDASTMIANLDSNQDGKVDASEMEAGMAKHRQEMKGQAQNLDQGQKQSQTSGMTEVTTALLNILKQLQDSQSNDESDSQNNDVLTSLASAADGTSL